MDENVDVASLVPQELVRRINEQIVEVSFPQVSEDGQQIVVAPFHILSSMCQVPVALKSNVTSTSTHVLMLLYDVESATSASTILCEEIKENLNLLMKELLDNRKSLEAAELLASASGNVNDVSAASHARQLHEARKTKIAAATRHMHNSQPKKMARAQNGDR